MPPALLPDFATMLFLFLRQTPIAQIIFTTHRRHRRRRLRYTRVHFASAIARLQRPPARRRISIFAAAARRC